jgi:enoyl-CoA hydratase/carnithine racemase
MNTDHCLLEREGHVLVVTRNRPEAKSALSSGMLAGMYRAWRMLDADSELRVAILTGRGDVFCAGTDSKAMGGGAEILLTGRHVTAQEALASGLVGRVVPKGQALAEAKKVAAEICDNAPLSVRALVRMLREIDASYSEADALVKELEIGGPIFATKDAREGPRAFAEKRKPVYTGQ